MTIPRTPQLVFVYGSLKQGFGNATLFADPNDAMYCGDFFTKNADYSMYNYGGFPAVVRKNSGGHHITGEVYLVTPAMLRRLDRLEGAPDWYERKRVFLDDGSLAWMYVLPKPNHLPEIVVDEENNSQTWIEPQRRQELLDDLPF